MLWNKVKLFVSTLHLYGQIRLTALFLVILEAEAETSDFYVVVSGIVRVVMKFAFEETVTKSNHASTAQKPRTPKELTICKLGPQNIIGDFCVGRKSKSPVAFIADSPQVRYLSLISACVLSWIIQLHLSSVCYSVGQTHCIL